MDNDIKQALECALETEYAWVKSWNDEQYAYCFSDEFLIRMKKIFKIADKQYISIGHFRLTKMAVAALLIAVLMILAGCGYIVQQAVIHWNETANTEQGTIDIVFDVEDPDNTLTDSGFIKPELPDGYSVTTEEKSEDSYYIEYTKDNYYIIYQQEKGIEDIGLSIDSENNDLKEIEISGNKGYSSSKYGVQAITWSDGIYLYDIYGNCTLKQLEQMAESIIK